MSGRDYERIEQAILYLERRYRDQPSLGELAEHIGLSQSHFQRLFQRWAGISPKRFLQFLTLEDAKRRLKESASVLDATFDTGLSSPGRLHDLFVKLDAVTPGEYKTSGSELQILYGFHATPFGEAFFAVTGRGICGLEFVVNGDHASVVEGFRERWSRASVEQDQRMTEPLVECVFGNVTARRGQPLSVFVKGTNFQVRVWEALLKLPIGTVTTYGALAKHLGNDRASRAVGAAVGQNGIGYLIPCHRAIQSSGIAHRYRWGTARKKAMLGWEAARVLESDTRS
ncbi:MAG: bifunctional helix-turn-helix domain-containing protein/methylated-DNA--[protein]-cysteine S-methyltransferase [Planctomycetia bacterium]|nr:bifunctional helix-turn-helix domain-containing protein/methylated-DNA--[protein]-cysteine S-methyltransferase [Planctomycetia bacterium]